MSKVSFNGKIAYTTDGNPYEKTNTGKKVFAGIGVLAAGFQAYKYKKAVDENLKELSNQAKKTNGIFVALIMALIVGSNIATGAIVDYFINKSRQKTADADVEDN